jgi:putative membrane protein
VFRTGGIRVKPDIPLYLVARKCPNDPNDSEPIGVDPRQRRRVPGRLLHVYILVLEMFLWDKPMGLRAFKLTPEFAAQSKVLAANQGLYNGFLAAGLFWGLYLGADGHAVKIFFLLCVLVAGIYGAATANRRILFIQAVPAAAGLVLLALQ